MAQPRLSQSVTRLQQQHEAYLETETGKNPSPPHSAAALALLEQFLSGLDGFANAGKTDLENLAECFTTKF
jgi:hypothetical protein